MNKFQEYVIAQYAKVHNIPTGLFGKTRNRAFTSLCEAIAKQDQHHSGITRQIGGLDILPGLLINANAVSCTGIYPEDVLEQLDQLDIPHSEFIEETSGITYGDGYSFIFEDNPNRENYRAIIQGPSRIGPTEKKVAGEILKLAPGGIYLHPTGASVNRWNLEELARGKLYVPPEADKEGSFIPYQLDRKLQD